MHLEFNNIQEEKNYWRDRLTRTTKEMIQKGAKKKKTLKPVTQTRFMLTNKNNYQNRSVLAEAGMLTLNPNYYPRKRRGRASNTLSNLAGTLSRPLSGSPSYFRRNNRLRSSKIKATGNREKNLSKTIGKINKEIQEQIVVKIEVLIEIDLI